MVRKYSYLLSCQEINEENNLHLICGWQMWSYSQNLSLLRLIEILDGLWSVFSTFFVKSSLLLNFWPSEVHDVFILVMSFPEDMEYFYTNKRLKLLLYTYSLQTALIRLSFSFLTFSVMFPLIVYCNLQLHESNITWLKHRTASTTKTKKTKKKREKEQDRIGTTETPETFQTGVWSQPQTWYHFLKYRKKLVFYTKVWK